MTVAELINQLKQFPPEERITSDFWTSGEIKETAKNIGIELSDTDIEEVHNKMDNVMCSSLLLSDKIKSVVAAKFNN